MFHYNYENNKAKPFYQNLEIVQNKKFIHGMCMLKQRQRTP